MHRQALIFLTLTLAGCGTSADSPVSSSAVSTSAKSAAQPSAVETVALNSGWNPVGLKYSQISTVAPGSAVGYAWWDGTAYQTGNLTTAELNAGAGPFRGFFAFSTGAGNFTYDGDNSRANSLTLRSGWNLLAFPAPAPFSASNLQAAVGGQNVSLSSVLLPTAYELQGDLSFRQADLLAASTLLGNGRPYWVFSSSNNVTLTYGTGPAPSPTATPIPAGSPAGPTEEPPPRPSVAPRPVTFLSQPFDVAQDGSGVTSASPAPEPLVSPTPFPTPPESEAEPDQTSDESRGKVFGTDTRAARNPSASRLEDPYAQQCKIYATSRTGNVSMIGSGTLIGRRHILTAGHVIYDHARGGFMGNMTIVPCQYTDSSGTIIAPWGQFQARTFITRTEWITDKSDDYDIGLVVTDADSSGTYPGDYAGWMAYGVRDLNNKTGHQSSYPGDRNNGDRQFYSYGLLRTGIFDLWKGQFSYPSSKRVVYDFDTAGGSSGAGLWLKEGSKRVIVAVHQGGDPKYSYWNTATTITSEIFDWLGLQRRENR